MKGKDLEDADPTCPLSPTEEARLRALEAVADPSGITICRNPEVPDRWAMEVCGHRAVWTAPDVADPIERWVLRGEGTPSGVVAALRRVVERPAEHPN